MITFGQRFKKLKSAKGLTYTQIAQTLDLKERTVKGYAADTIKPSFDALIALADLFDVPLDYLLGRGIFEHWDQIMDDPMLKELFIGALEAMIRNMPFNLREKSELDLMHILPAFIKKIELDETGQMSFLLYK